MNELTFDDLLNKIKEYSNSNLTMVKKAYLLACKFHKDQKRASGEPYIIHPLNVAYILAQMQCDIDTICAGLLHDVVEDTPCTLDVIKEEFNETVSMLVDGVTNISNIAFSTPKELNLANTRRIIASVVKDIRIVIIKIADRLHNMRTLDFKPKDKQVKKAFETMEIFVPLAYSIGSYRIKNELEDLSFKYLKPDEYNNTTQIYNDLKEKSDSCMHIVESQIKSKLYNDGITNSTKIRVKHIYGIYKLLSQGNKISEIHDLLNLKVILPSISECYLTLGRVHSLYNPLNSKFKDYIYNPKTNLYQSLHTTVFAPDELLVQIQIRTFEMDKVASFGFPAYFHIMQGDSRETMQEQLTEKFQFVDNLKEINEFFYDNEVFVNNVKKELFSEMIYVYDTDGNYIELPLHSTPIDFAYHLNKNMGNQIVKAYINDEEVPLNRELQNNDRVKIITDIRAFPKKEWENIVHTTKAKRRIKDFNIAKSAILK